MSYTLLKLYSNKDSSLESIIWDKDIFNTEMSPSGLSKSEIWGIL